MAKIRNTSSEHYRGCGQTIAAGATVDVADFVARYLLDVFGERFVLVATEGSAKRSPKQQQVRKPKQTR